jgi:hypothetical protein
MRSMCQTDIHFFLVSCMLHEQAVSVDPKVVSLATTRTRTEHREERSRMDRVDDRLMEMWLEACRLSFSVVFYYMS